MKKKLRSTFLLESLEARLLFSADLAPLPVDAGVLRPEAESGLEISLQPDNGGVQAADAHEQLRQEIIFVDEGVDDYQRLIFDLESQLEQGRQFDIVALDSDHDGIAQISAYLRQHQDIDAVHVISHGADGEAVLGNNRLNTTTLDGYAQAIEGWQQALSGDADLLFYGCDLAAGNDGQDLVNSLTLLTGADVAASDDVTGSAKLGGDWVLEYGKGEIETAMALNSATQQSWNGVLATFTVTTTTDGGAGSLRQAIIDANALGGANEIILAAGTYTLSLGPAGDDAAANGDLDVTGELTISGAGADVTVIDANSLDRVFHLKGNAANLTLKDLTVTGGSINDKGGGIFVEHWMAQLTATRVIVTGNIAAEGAGIFNDGTMTLTDVVISNNGDATTHEGGGIHNKEMAILERVTVSGNRADMAGGSGGGIHDYITATSLSLTNVTVSGNSADGKGGGLHIQNAVTILNSTFTLNSANSGGGISNNGGTVNIKNTIVAENLAGLDPDVEGSFISQGYNLIGDKGTVTDFTAAGDQAGTAGSPIDPMLGSLWDNGGFTETHALLAGSPAIDPAGLTGAPPPDQRGFARDVTPDIGAFEYNTTNTAPTLTVTGAATVKEGTVYTLNLSASDPDSHTIIRWTINWGDGTIETIPGNSSAVTHTYTQAGFTYNITVSATDVTGTYIAGDLISTSLINDRVYWFDANNPLINTWEDLPGFGNSPVDVQVGPDGETYVTGYGSDKIFRYNADGSFDTTFVNGNGLNAPSRIAFGPDGNLYVTNMFNNEVLRFSGVDGTSNGIAMGAFISTNLNQPDGITFGPDGNLYVGNRGTGDVLRFDGVTGALDPTFTANGLPGYMDIQFGPDGLLWVTNTSSNDIRRYRATDGAYVDTFASAPVGATDFAGIAFGPDGYVYLSDAFDNDKIIRYPIDDGSAPEPFVSSNLGGIDQPVNIVFTPAHQVMVIANQAPVLSGGPYDLGSTDEDTISTGVQVTTILGGLTSSDADGDPLGIAVVTANGNGTWEYSTNSTNGTDGTWTAFGSVNGSSALLLSESSWVRYVPDGLNGETASLTIHAWDGTSGTASTTGAPSTADPSVGSAFSSATADASLTVTELSDASAVVWLTTKGNANAGGLSWSDAEIAEFGDAGDAFDIEAGLTSGTFAKLTGFSAPADIRAMHYVETNISLGTTGIKFPLQPGDLILTLDTGAGNVELNTHDDPANPGNNFFADRKDIVVFRPDVAGDYSSGEWFMLLEEGVSNSGTTYNVHALTLVERDTTVGDTLLQRGTFLVAHSNPSLHSNVYTFSVIGTGIGANTQTTDTNALLLGTPLGNGSDQIQGLHLVQQDTGFGTAVLKWGTLLVEVNGSSTFAGQAQEPFDILALTVTQTEQDASPGTAATGSLLFDGSDIGLTDGAEEPVNGLTIVSDSFPLFTNSAPNISGGPYNLGSTDEDTTTVGTQVSTILGGLTANDADGDDLGLAVTTASGNGTWQYSTDSTDGSNGSWTDFSAVAVNSAMLLSNTSWVRYEPDLLNGETADLTFHAWDGSTGSASVTGSPSTADPAGGGGATAYSNSTAIANLTVTDLNDVPTITSVANTAATEDLAYSYTLTVNDVDVGDTLTLSAPTLPGWLTFNTSTGLLSGIPTNAEVGDHAVVLRVNDGTVDVDQSFTITVANVNDPGTVTIDNLTPAQGDTLTASVSDPDGATGAIAYQWKRDGADIGAATGVSYTTTQADVGAVITVTAIYTDDLSSAESLISAGTAAVTNINDPGTVTIDNMTPAQGETLTAGVSDPDGASGAIAYQWKRDGADIATATGVSYTTTQADVGAVITVTAIYTDDLFSAESLISAGTAMVTNINDPGTVTIDNMTPAQGDTLTAGVSDPDGASGAIAYQWKRDGADIATATGVSYTTTQADVGAVITVTAIYTDDLFSAESLISAGTAMVTNINDPGTVTIDNLTPAQGDTLTASVSDPDGATGAIAYQWKRDGADIGAATGVSYTTTQADVGAVITVTAIYTDDLSSAESLISAGTAAVTNINDPGTVTIDNMTPAQGETLTAGVSDPDGASGAIAYQWKRDGADIATATGVSYTTTQADVGAVITVTAIYTDDLFSAESLISAGTAMVTNINDPGTVTIDNLTPAQGETLTAGVSDPDGASGAIAYQWKRDGADIATATGVSYTTTQADVGAVITVTAIYTDDLFSAESLISAGTAMVTNINDPGTVTIDNLTPAQGDTLTASVSDPDGATGAIAYQWKRDGADIGAATGVSYTTTQADVGAVITVTAIYTDDLSSAESLISAGTAAVTNINDPGTVTIDNLTPAQGDTLTASVSDPDGATGAIAYQWKRDGADIGAATGVSYTTTQADVGAVITVTAIYTDDLSSAESLISAGTAAVTNINDPGTVTIDNMTPAQGETLTAGVSDPDGASGAIAYQWKRDGADIATATGVSYTTTQADVGAVITVTAIYTDDLFSAESLISAGTAMVTNINDPGTVTIDNMTPAQGDTLTANVSDPDGVPATISYQWFSDGAAIGGASGKTYTTVQADVGTIITVSADYTDDQSTVESLTSAGTAAVTNVNDTPIAVNDNLNATEDHSMTITSVTDLLGNDSDMDGDTLTLSGFTQPANGILVDNADGTLAYTPGGNFWGIDSFTYTISDGNSGTASGTAIIVIAPVGDTPQVTDVSTLSEVQSGLIFINRYASDGAEVSHFKISGISNGSLYLADGVTGLDNGDFIAVAQGQAGLRFTPAADSTVNGSFKVESSEDGVSVASQSGIATSVITILTPASPPAASEPSPPPSEPVTDEDVVEEEAEATDDLADETDVSADADDIFSVAKPQSYKAPSTAKPSFISGIADHNPANSDSDDKTLDRSTLLSPQSLKMLLEAQNLGELKTALGKLNITTLSSADYELVRNSLDAIKEEMGKEILLGKTVLGSAMATTVGLSAGYVVWMLKGGSLLASVLSSLPAWQLADPLAILVGKKDDDDDDDESLETIIKEGSARDKDKKRKASELNNLRKDSAKR